MDHLWSPWRYKYVSTIAGKADECVFCAKPAAQDRESYIILRAERNYLMLNRYPYTSGHLLIAPYEHVSTLGAAHPDTMTEMMQLTVRAEQALWKVYKPDGINVGMNLGASAGAGVAGHIHMHVLPRWYGDASFMTTVGETRVIPEDLETTYQRLKEVLTSNQL